MHFVKKIAAAFLILPFITGYLVRAESFKLPAENSRSDSVDILDYDIHLNVTDYAGKTISGHCIVSFKSKINNLSFIDLDLLKLHIDSVKQNNSSVSFTYSDSLTLRITLLSALNAGDSTGVVVYYHGKPEQDSGGWGGWYWSGDYSFNIGVALYDIPHTYGRVWFPCVDNFVERSTYHFSIITPSDKMALCNGELVSSVDNGNGTKTWNWQLLETIPSYLACVAVNKYAPAYGVYYGQEDTIPIQYGAIAADTTKMKNSFLNLAGAMEAFENAWGPYRWNKVGFCETTVGAMEHSTNIAYPVSLINGQTTYESYMAHELSHQWFGDLVTCRTAEEMWLNEGWADFCVKIFYEHVYGKQRYKDEVAANHEYCVHYVHTSLSDGAYYPPGNIPQTKTYGETVYRKGADMAHTLRGYMGDSLFFTCIKNYLDAFAFKDASNEDFRDYLSSCSGIDLTHYFNDWIFSEGWTAFNIDSVEVTSSGGSYDATIYLRQRLNHAPHFYTKVPLEISFYDQNWNKERRTVEMSGACNAFTVSLPFNPVYAGLDLDEKISDAVTADLDTVSSTGDITLTYGKMTLDVSGTTDPSLLRVEHIYAAPDPIKNASPNLHISQERFWKVDGINLSGLDASATITYNGLTGYGGFLDNQLISNVEDSLVVLYRLSVSKDWKVEPDVTQNFSGSHSDKRGSFTINHLKKGEYTFGIYDFDKVDSVLVTGTDTCLLISAPVPSDDKGMFRIFPNPATDEVTLEFSSSPGNHYAEIFNLYGVSIWEQVVSGGFCTIDTSRWQKGLYMVRISDHANRLSSSQLFIVQ